MKTAVRAGPPAEELLKVAREEGVDLIITGHSCKDFFSRLLKGSVSRDIARNGTIPFLVAKDATCGEQSTRRGTREWIKGRSPRPAVVPERY